MKKAIFLISLGFFNALHGLMHFVQFIQSLFLIAYSTTHHEEHGNFIEKIMNNPIFSLIMAIIGISTLVIGIKDFIHHRRCKNN